MLELVDNRDLKFRGLMPSGFEPRSPHQPFRNLTLVKKLNRVPPCAKGNPMSAQAQQADSWSNSNPPGHDPMKQEVDPRSLGIDPNTNRVEHQAIADPEPFKDSGKDIAQIHAPIVSLHPTSGNQDNEKKDYEVFDNANRFLNHTGPRYDFAYPFMDIEIGQGFFVPVQQNSNIDKLIAHLHRAISAFHKQTSVEEKDENGDDVMESVTVLPKKRTPDGIIQLDSAGKPIVGANHTNRPKLVHMAQFAIKAAVKGDDIADGKKAESDGALVIRVA